MSTPGKGGWSRRWPRDQITPRHGSFVDNYIGAKARLRSSESRPIGDNRLLLVKKRSQHIGYVVKVITLTMSHTVDTLCINIENDDIHNYANNLILDDMIPIKWHVFVTHGKGCLYAFNSTEKRNVYLGIARWGEGVTRQLQMFKKVEYGGAIFKF